MNKLKSFLSASKTNVVVFVLTAVLILSATIGAASAAISYISTYDSRMQMFDIGVTLLENGDRVSWRDYSSSAKSGWDENMGVLLTNMIPEGEEFALGKTYPEVLSVRNSGTINQYVRVSIYKYWVNPNEFVKDPDDGHLYNPKLLELDPSNIQLNILCDATGHSNGWLLDRDSSTAERIVLYYNQLLHSEKDGSGATETSPFSDTLTINNDIASKVETITTKNNGYTTFEYVYSYDGAQFIVEVQVDAVQENNAGDAILSAWGRNVGIGDDGSLYLH